MGVDDLPLPEYQRPEIAIDVNGNKSFNIVGAMLDIQIEGLAVHGDTGSNTIIGGGDDALINNNGSENTNLVIGVSDDGVGEAVVVGLLPDGSLPNIPQFWFGIRTLGTTTTTVRNSLVAENGSGGIVGEAEDGVERLWFGSIQQWMVFGRR